MNNQILQQGRRVALELFVLLQLLKSATLPKPKFSNNLTPAEWRKLFAAVNAAHKRRGKRGSTSLGQ